MPEAKAILGGNRIQVFPSYKCPEIPYPEMQIRSKIRPVTYADTILEKKPA